MSISASVVKLNKISLIENIFLTLLRPLFNLHWLWPLGFGAPFKAFSVTACHSAWERPEQKALLAVEVLPPQHLSAVHQRVWLRHHLKHRPNAVHLHAENSVHEPGKANQSSWSFDSLTKRIAVSQSFCTISKLCWKLHTRFINEV